VSIVSEPCSVVPTLDDLVDDMLLRYERAVVMIGRGLITQTEYSNMLVESILPVHQHVMKERAKAGATVWVSEGDAAINAAYEAQWDGVTNRYVALPA
jgi:hypothetical protein